MINQLISLLFAVILFIVSFVAGAATPLPVNPMVTQDNIHETICVPGWSATVRPPQSYTNAVKKRLLDANDISRLEISEFELDHIIPLTLGGHPRSIHNLTLQSWYTKDGWHGEQNAHLKDVLEVRLNRLVCRGVIPLRVAQQCIYNGWRQCSKEYP